MILSLYVAHSGRANVTSIIYRTKFLHPKDEFYLGKRCQLLHRHLDLVMNASHEKKKIHNMSIVVYGAKDTFCQSIVHAKNSPNWASRLGSSSLQNQGGSTSFKLGHGLRAMLQRKAQSTFTVELYTLPYIPEQQDYTSSPHASNVGGCLRHGGND